MALTFTTAPSVTAKTGNSYTLGGTLSEEGNVFAVAVLSTDTAPTTPQQIILGHNGADTAARGAGNAATNESGVFGFNVTGGTLGDNPIHNIHVVGRTIGEDEPEPVEPDYWEMTVTTPSDAATWSVNIAAGSTPNILVNWGDSSSDTYTITGVKNHEYATAGTYTVRISGTFASGGCIRLGNTGNFAYLKTVQPVGGITKIGNFQSSMRGCTGLTSLPENLFRWVIPGAAGNAFYDTFYECTGLSSIPANLFRYNTGISDNAFFQTFFGCTGLTSIPADLFRYNTAVSSNGFYNTFYNCTGITSIPADLFRYNIAVSTAGFRGAFWNCSNLTTAPALLFKYNTACTSFENVFLNCNKLQLRADLFFDTGEASTRFLNQSVNFNQAMRIGTFTGTQGTAPALWTCDFGSGTPTTTNCFTGQTTSSVTNHADIPTAWGGPA
jgi:hypothetical protein